MTDYDQMRSALAEALDLEDTGQPWTLLVEQVWAMRQRLAALAADNPPGDRCPTCGSDDWHVIGPECRGTPADFHFGHTQPTESEGR